MCWLLLLLSNCGRHYYCMTFINKIVPLYTIIHIINLFISNIHINKFFWLSCVWDRCSVWYNGMVCIFLKIWVQSYLSALTNLISTYNVNFESYRRTDQKKYNKQHHFTIEIIAQDNIKYKYVVPNKNKTALHQILVF